MIGNRSAMVMNKQIIEQTKQNKTKFTITKKKIVKKITVDVCSFLTEGLFRDSK